ncbi:MAG: DUF86 domain-containing protein [Chloroflexi bacterium]|nr:DUF86 domain-containing protein [Chloroflexota bacterium]
MSAKRVYIDYLQDIVDYAEKAMRFVQGVSYDDFADNEEKVFAVVKAIEIVGEAARNIPKSLRAKYPAVPWVQVTGMRNKVTHEYFSVDLEVVWKTVKEDLPALRKTVRQMLDDISRQDVQS